MMRLSVRALCMVGIILRCCISVSPGACQERPRAAATVLGIERASSKSQLLELARNEVQQAAELRHRLTHADLQKAIYLLNDGARRFADAGAAQESASADLLVGDTYQMLSDYRYALAVYQRALAIDPHDPAKNCSVLAHIARTYASMGSNAEAEQYSQQTSDVCETVSDKKVLADALEARGEVKFWAADIDAATGFLEQARQLAAQAGDESTEAVSMMMLAQITHNSDRGRSAELARGALSLWKQQDDEYGTARGHLAMAFFAGEDGNFKNARCHCEQALSTFKKIDDKDNEGIALNNLGLVARQGGDTDAALTAYSEARKNFVAAQDSLGEADSLSGIAGIRRDRNEYGSLLQLYQRELYLAKITKNAGLRASALESIADVHLHSHRYALAESYYRQTLDEYSRIQNHYGEGEACLRLASLSMEQGKFAQASAMLVQARRLKEQTGEIEAQAHIGYLQARIDLNLNQLDEARSEIEKTVSIIESQRLQIDKFDSRAQYLASVHEDYALYIHILMALHASHPDQHFGELALEVAERSKMRSLLDMLGDRHENTPCAEALAREAASADVPLPPQPAVTASEDSAHALKVSEIEATISDKNTALLEYALDDDRIFAWVVDGDRVTAFDLGTAAKVRANTKGLLKAMAPTPARPDESPLAYLQRVQTSKALALEDSKQLANLLLRPFNLPSQKRLLIVSDGLLQYVPFAELPVSNVTGQRAQPMVSQNELVMLPSASVLSSLRKIAAGRPRPTDGVSVFADPVFEKTTANASANAMASDNTRSLTRAWKDAHGSAHIPSLPGSRAEAFAIEQVFGPARTRLALGYDANREAVLDGSLAHQQIVHFATHGIANNDHPEMSGLVLSLRTKNGNPRDGYLRLSDIYNLKLSADLVVLSSCESALGKDLGSEGIIGLPRGFLFAGARSVIATLWKVDDSATAALMREMYSGMEHGDTPAKALQEAQLAMRRSKSYSAPYYWAAFFLEGDYK